MGDVLMTDLEALMLRALKDARIQIEYLHERFAETGSGKSTLARINFAIAEAEEHAKWDDVRA
jgi:hypothetical protein